MTTDLSDNQKTASEGTCVCDATYTGTKCDTYVEPGSILCHNGEIARSSTDAICSCYAGFSGDACETQEPADSYCCDGPLCCCSLGLKDTSPQWCTLYSDLCQGCS